MADIREAVPADMQTFWDMTISAYWGWSCWDAREGQFHSAQGAGGLGFGFPAAIGGAVGLETTGKPAVRPGCWPSPATARRCTRSPSWPPPSSTTSRSPG